MGVGFAAAFKQRDRGQGASEYGLLMVLVVLVVLSGVIFFGQNVRRSMEQASKCIEFASSADASAGTSSGGAAVRTEEEEKSGSLADRLAALLDTNNESDESLAGSAEAGAGSGGKAAGSARNLGNCPD